MLKINLINIIRRFSSLSLNEKLTNDLIRKRLLPYLSSTSYVDELSENVSKYKQLPKASVLLPLYCNEHTNQVEILVLKRSDKVRSHRGMVAFAGGMSDLTDRDTIHTAQREAEEEIGLQPNCYSILGCLPPITDSRAVMITPIVALLNSSKFVDFCLLNDETSEVFYLELKQFLYRKNNYKMSEIGDCFVTHHFHIDQYHIWGVTAFELIILATLIYQQLPQFPFFRHQQQLDLNLIKQQLQEHFQLCINYHKKEQIKKELDGISQ